MTALVLLVLLAFEGFVAMMVPKLPLFLRVVGPGKAL